MSEVQWFTLLVVLANICLETIWSIRNKRFRLKAIPSLVWFFHALIFYLSLIISPGLEVSSLDTTKFSIWSSILRLHGFMTMLIYSINRVGQNDSNIKIILGK